MNTLLEVTGLCKEYQSFTLKDVSFTLPEDCITGFIGVNGAGKTTTIRTILGLAQKSSGSIKIFGQDMDRNEKTIKNRLGIVMDEGGFYNEMSMDEMKSIIAPAYSKWSASDYSSYMEKFSLDKKQKIATLSKGMRMKFALVLALSHQADLLIMDEPTSGLDPLVRTQLLNIISDYMKQGGKGVFFSTHITSDLDKVADMLIMMHNGKILFENDKDELLDRHRLVKGDKSALSSDIRRYFINIQTSDYGFSGITNNVDEVQKVLKDIVVEKPRIEDIMLAHIEGRL